MQESQLISTIELHDGARHSVGKNELPIKRRSLWIQSSNTGRSRRNSHMDTSAVVHGFLSPQQLENALTCMDLVIIPTEVPWKPGMTRDDFFNTNAGIVKTLCEGIVKCCPGAIVNLISNCVNSTVTIAAEKFWGLILKKLTVQSDNFNPPLSGNTTMLFTPEEIKYLTARIQNGGIEVVETKARSGSAQDQCNITFKNPDVAVFLGSSF
ncbi:Lactate/malate dehydrogenase, N-terminal [Dillenia turbinata]|uniref:malate dehydrogenase n=1 Tax=Dillenia turbinata TaxID=194707 RepID=A0AAN8ULK3_9MAGN